MVAALSLYKFDTKYANTIVIGENSMLLPHQTREDIANAGWHTWLLAFVGIATIGRAALHLWLPDGGAGSIAGIDLTVAGERTVGLFAWAGSTQLVWGIVLAAIALRYRSLATMAFVLLFLENLLQALSQLGPKGGAGTIPPEAFIPVSATVLYAAVLTFLFFKQHT